MSARFNFTTCCLFTLLLVGCDSARSKTDVGPTYVGPPGTGSQTIDGVDYTYVAPAERQQAIISGYAQLKVGQTREEVRTLLGVPDSALPMQPHQSFRFLGWHYVYHIRTVFNWTNTSDQWVEMMFEPSGGRLYWAHSNAIPGLTDVGAQEP